MTSKNIKVEEKRTGSRWGGGGGGEAPRLHGFQVHYFLDLTQKSCNIAPFTRDARYSRDSIRYRGDSLELSTPLTDSLSFLLSLDFHSWKIRQLTRPQALRERESVCVCVCVCVCVWERERERERERVIIIKNRCESVTSVPTAKHGAMERNT